MARTGAKGVDFKAFCTASFLIDASPAQADTAFGEYAKGFFTKLSTEFVHQRGSAVDDGVKPSGNGRAAMNGRGAAMA